MSTISGRGVGMGATLDATRALDGRFDVQSEPGQGTTCTWVFPAKQFSALTL